MIRILISCIARIDPRSVSTERFRSFERPWSAAFAEVCATIESDTCIRVSGWVMNTGSRAWHTGGELGAIRLGLSMLCESVSNEVEARFDFVHSILPPGMGESFEFEIPVLKAPLSWQEMRLDMVKEGEFWFRTPCVLYPYQRGDDRASGVRIYRKGPLRSPPPLVLVVATDGQKNDALVEGYEVLQLEIAKIGRESVLATNPVEMTELLGRGRCDVFVVNFSAVQMPNGCFTHLMNSLYEDSDIAVISPAVLDRSGSILRGGAMQCAAGFLKEDVAPYIHGRCARLTQRFFDYLPTDCFYIRSDSIDSFAPYFKEFPTSKRELFGAFLALRKKKLQLVVSTGAIVRERWQRNLAERCQRYAIEFGARGAA